MRLQSLPKCSDLMRMLKRPIPASETGFRSSGMGATYVLDQCQKTYSLFPRHLIKDW